MKKYFHLFLAIFILQSSFAQSTKIKIDQFNWTINIPSGYTEVAPDTWEDQLQRGQDFIEKTYGEELINETVTLFTYEKSEFNSIESNFQPFDEAVDGDYLVVFHQVNEMLYETFSQIPGVKIKKKKGKKIIDDLLFHTYEMKIVYPNKMVLHFNMFCKLFNKEELTINILYVDEKEGEMLKNALFTSSFKK